MKRIFTDQKQNSKKRCLRHTDLFIFDEHGSQKQRTERPLDTDFIDYTEQKTEDIKLDANCANITKYLGNIEWEKRGGLRAEIRTDLPKLPAVVITE